MYDITMTILIYIPWVIMFFYCFITPLVGLMEREQIVYPLIVSTFFAFVGVIAFAINFVAIP